MTTPCAPIDDTHRDSLVYIEQIRRRLRLVLYEVDCWKPKPCPSDWTGREPRT